MNIQLQHISIQSFKGLKHFETDFNGQTVIRGANGTGKTTVFDAFLWLLFSKDSTGRKDFEVRPLDSHNRVIKGVDVVVEAAICFDGTTHVLRKEQKEKKVKGVTGYETQCYIDEVPKKVSEYADWVSNMVPEDAFKMLTDLHYFGEKMHWKERRAVLLSIAGPVGSPKGFDDLIAKLNGRSIDDYKIVLQGQKKRLEKDRDEINPRIDELQRGCDSYVGVDEKRLEGQRNSLMLKKQTLATELNVLLTSETGRQALLDSINALKRRQVERESELANDTTGVTHLLNEKAALETAVADAAQAVERAKFDLRSHQQVIKMAQMERDNVISRRDSLRKQYIQAKEKPLDDTCYACGQKLPVDKRADIEKKRQAEVAELERKTIAARDEARVAIAKVEDLEKRTALYQDEIDKAAIKAEEVRQHRTERLIVIDSQLKSQKKIDPKTDTVWKNLEADIQNMQKEVGEPAGGKMAELRTNLNAIDADIQAMNKSLAQADRNRQDTLRIKELADNEAKLSQQIADIDKEIEQIGQYKKAESGLIEAAVNHRFKRVTFKLFSYLLNGSIEDCCEAMLDGVPYSDCSYGQKIIMGIDVVNVLSAQHDLSIPLFIDNAESVTYDIEANGQTILLFADPDHTTLTVKTLSTQEAA